MWRFGGNKPFGPGGNFSIKNRRQHSHVPVNLAVKITSPAGQGPLHADSLSKSEITIPTHAPLNPGARIEFVLELPIDKKEISLKGLVINNHQGPDGKPTAMTVEFADLTAEQHEILDGYLSALRHSASAYWEKM